MNAQVQRAYANGLGEVLGLFDSVQAWLVACGLKEQWGSAPFSVDEMQRRRFAAWIRAGHFFLIKLNGEVVRTLVFSPEPPDYARNACGERVPGSYLEAFAVRRDYAGQGVGTTLLNWAEHEALSRGSDILRLDCWAENEVLRSYYRRAGFLEVASLEFNDWRGIMFEKRLKAPAP